MSGVPDEISADPEAHLPEAHLAFVRASIVAAAARRQPIFDRLRSYEQDVALIARLQARRELLAELDGWLRDLELGCEANGSLDAARSWRGFARAIQGRFGEGS